jgi:Na+-driven multidrug efflux pump
MICYDVVVGVVVLQASLMAQRLSLLPCLAILASAITNIGLDILLIVTFGMGTAGAAWATLASQYLAAAILFAVVSRVGRVRPVWHLPSSTELATFASSTGPLAFIYLCKNICYTAIQRAATGLPTLMLAAHQPVFMMWNLCAFSTSPLEQVRLPLLSRKHLLICSHRRGCRPANALWALSSSSPQRSIL